MDDRTGGASSASTADARDAGNARNARPADDHGAMVKTYRYLRGGLVGVVVLLIVAIGIEAVDAGCLQTSISAYYYTPVRAVFVGMLMILGFGLIVLRGHTSREDVLLNIAGMFAPVVAVMPTTDVGECGIIEPNPAPVVDGELAGWVVANVDNNLWALLVTGLAGVVATGVIGSVAVALQRRQGKAGTALSRGTGIGLAVTGAVLVVAMVAYAGWPDWIRDRAHGWSAVAMFVVFAVIVLLNARRRATGEVYRRIYLAVVILMVLFAVVCYGPLRNWDHQILILEAGEILLFAAYWAVQTREHWDETVLRSDDAGVRPSRVAVS